MVSVVSVSAQQTRAVTSSALTADSIRSVLGARDSVVRVIIEFNEPPLFVLNKQGLAKTDIATYNNRFATLAGDLAKAGIATYAEATSEMRTFTRVFFGAGMTVRSSALPDIARLPYVRAVHADKMVHAALSKSTTQIGVPEVWQTFGTQGQGVRVGVIDTGIDYLHSALGGGFGEGFKVAGGYDFVNNDPDPLDDNGHGTHVAGIIAADTDTIKGVAPKATLYAYKVLGANGSGLESDVILAVERAVDPNGDGDPSDRLDIVNLSLGSSTGSSTDPGSIAVDNASRLGVLFCVAAGNSGYPLTNHQNNYFLDGSASVGSPGTALLALTVGAVDSVDQLALFSSKGPNRHAFGIKPDVVAPGVNVVSTFLNGTYRGLNGTSMATPMVAGVAALLKSAHPDWSSTRIRSAIVNTAKDLGLSAFHQGTGRVRALAAASNSAWTVPTSFSFGLADPALSSWTRAETLYVHNGHASPQTFQTTVSGIPAGATLNVSPSSFSVNPGDSALVIATLSVNYGSIPLADGDILRFPGRIRFAGTVDTLHVPWAFARGARLTLSFNEPSPEFILYGGPTYSHSSERRVHWSSLTSAHYYGLAKQAYGVLTAFRSATGPEKFVIKEQAVLSDDEIIPINSGSATAPLIYKSVDHAGTPLAAYPARKKVLVTSIPQFGDWCPVFPGANDTLLLSPVPASYVFRPIEYQFDLAGTASFHIAQFAPFSSLASPRILINTPSEFVSQRFHVKVPPGAPQTIVISEFFSYKEMPGPDGPMGGLVGISYEADTLTVTDDEVRFNGYFGRSPSVEDVALTFHTTSDLAGLTLDLSTPPIMLSNDSLLATTRINAQITTRKSPSAGTMLFGTPPIHMFVPWYNNIFSGASLHFQTLFRGMQRETRHKDVNTGTYSIYNAAGDLVFTNPLNDFPRSPRELTPERYKVVMTASNHRLGPLQGQVKLTSEFDLGAVPAIPPTVTSFQVLDASGQPRHAIKPGAPASLLFSGLVLHLLLDSNLPLADSTKAWYRLHGSADWLPLTVQAIGHDSTREGSVFRADLSAATVHDSAAVDLRVYLKERSGFWTEYEISPAFGVGTWLGEFQDPTNIGKNPAIPVAFGLEQNYPNPFNGLSTIEFSIDKRSPVSLKVYDLLGRQVHVLLDEERLPGLHRVTWNSGSLPSGVYFYRLQSGSRTAVRKMVLVR